MSHLRITDSHAREKKKRSVVREVEGQGDGIRVKEKEEKEEEDDAKIRVSGTRRGREVRRGDGPTQGLN